MRTSPSSSWTPVTSGWRKPAYLGRGGPARGHQDRGRPARPAETLSPQTDGTGRFIGMPGTNGEPRWLTDDEQQAWRATVHLSQLLMRQLDRDLNMHGLNGHDYEILVELSEAPDNRLRMTELADATSQSRSRLSHQISRMESRGLVRRDNWTVPGEYFFFGLDNDWPHRHECLRVNFSGDAETVREGYRLIAA